MPHFDLLVCTIKGCLIPQGVHHRVPESLRMFYLRVSAKIKIRMDGADESEIKVHCKNNSSAVQCYA